MRPASQKMNNERHWVANLRPIANRPGRVTTLGWVSHGLSCQAAAGCQLASGGRLAIGRRLATCPTTASSGIFRPCHPALRWFGADSDIIALMRSHWMLTSSPRPPCCPLCMRRRPRLQDSAADWPMYNRDLAGTRYSPLAQINTKNVAKLTRRGRIACSATTAQPQGRRVPKPRPSS